MDRTIGDLECDGRLRDIRGQRGVDPLSLAAGVVDLRARRPLHGRTSQGRKQWFRMHDIFGRRRVVRPGSLQRLSDLLHQRVDEHVRAGHGKLQRGGRLSIQRLSESHVESCARVRGFDASSGSCGECTTHSGALSSSCDSCTASVCSHDSYCCNTAWDSQCVSEVTTYCGASTCSDGGTVDSGADAAQDSSVDAAKDSSVDAAKDSASDSSADAPVDAPSDSGVVPPLCRHPRWLRFRFPPSHSEFLAMFVRLTPTIRRASQTRFSAQYSPACSRRAYP